VPGFHQVARQPAAPAPELHDEPPSIEQRFDPSEDPRRHVVGVKSKTKVVHEREVRTVVGSSAGHGLSEYAQAQSLALRRASHLSGHFAPVGNFAGRFDRFVSSVSCLSLTWR
jgi:hypothetical protein